MVNRGGIYGDLTGDGKEFIFDYSPMMSAMDEIRKQVAERIAADTEGKFRQALIELGWTPPETK